MERRTLRSQQALGTEASADAHGSEPKRPKAKNRGRDSESMQAAGDTGHLDASKRGVSRKTERQRQSAATECDKSAESRGRKITKETDTTNRGQASKQAEFEKRRAHADTSDAELRGRAPKKAPKQQAERAGARKRKTSDIDEGFEDFRARTGNMQTMV